MDNKPLRDFHKTLFVPLKLKERLDYLNIPLRELFNFSSLVERKVGVSYLSFFVSFNDNLELERSLFSKEGLFYTGKDILEVWQEYGKSDELLSVKDLVKVNKAEDEVSPSNYSLFHDERTIYIVLDGTKPNLLNLPLKDLSRDVTKTLSLYYKPHVYTNHPWFNLYLEKL